MATLVTGETGPAITPDESKELSRRIRESLSFDAGVEERMFQARIENDQRRRQIKSGIEQMDRRERMNFWRFKLRHGKDDIASYEPYCLEAARRRVQAAHESLENFDGASLPAATGELFRSLMRALRPVQPLFERIWESERSLTNAIRSVMVRRIDDVRSGLSDFMSQREMQELYLAEQSKTKIKEIVLERLKSHLTSLGTDQLTLLEPGILPVYYLQPLTRMDFSNLALQFGIDPEGLGSDKLQRVNIGSCIEDLEKLFFALYLAHKLPRPIAIHRELVAHALGIAGGEYHSSAPGRPDGNWGGGADPDDAAPAGAKPGDERPGDGGPGGEPGDADSTAEQKRRVDSAIDGIAAAVHQAEEFARLVPLADIIRVYREDAFYRLQIYVPRVRLAIFYRAQLRRTVLEDLDRRFGDVRMGVIGYIINELFGGDLDELRYYGNWSNPKENRVGLPGFQYQMAMRAVRSYLDGHYRSRTQDEIRVVSRILPARRRDDQGKLLQHAAGLEDVGDRLKNVDTSFGPDNPDGQHLYRMRQLLDKDLGQQKAFRSFQAQKHREIRGYLDLALEHIEGIEQVFVEVQKMDSTNLDDRYRNFDPWVPRPTSLAAMLKLEIGRLRMLRGLISETIALDEGY